MHDYDTGMMGCMMLSAPRLQNVSSLIGEATLQAIFCFGVNGKLMSLNILRANLAAFVTECVAQI